MPSVDNRVVEMRFDNKEFESGVSTSLSTLEKLKQSLKLEDAAKGFENLDKASKGISFDGISASLQVVSDHFSALGIVGDQVLRRIGDAIFDLEMRFVNLVKSMSVDQIISGWSKYEEKTTSVQTIMNATGKSIDEVNGYLDKLMWFSDETSYGFTDMTKAIATMAAKGGDIEKLIPMVTGVANAVAFAGKSAGEFSSIMEYSINQAYGAGYMGLQDWKTIQSRGVGSKQLIEQFIAAGEALGKIKEGEVTLGNFTETLKKKWLDTEVMEQAFGYFGEMTEKAYELIEAGEFDTATEAYAYLATQYDTISMKAAKAAQEAKTFQEAIDATKDAVSSKWLETFELIFGNYEEAKMLWSWLAEELWEVFASGGDERNEMLQMWHDGIDGVSGYAMAVESLQNIWYGLKGILYAVKDAIADVFPPTTAERLMSITTAVHEFSERFRDAFAYVQDVEEAITDFIEPVAKAADEVAEVSTNIAQAAYDVDELARRVLSGEFGNGGDRVQALRELGYSYELVQNRVNEMLGCNVRMEVSEEDLAKAYGQTGEAIEEVGDALESVDMEEQSESVEKTSDIIANLQNTIRGIASAIDIVGQAASAVNKVVIQPLLRVAFGLLAKVLNITGGIGLKITDLAARLREENFFETKLQGLVDWLVNVKNRLKDFIDQVKELPAVKDFLATMQQLGKWFASAKNWAVEKITGFFAGLKKFKINPAVSQSILNFINRAFEGINKLFIALQPFASWLLERVRAGFNALSNVDFSRFTDAMRTVFGWLSEKLAPVKNVLASAAAKIRDFFASFKDAHSIKDVFSILREKVQNLLSKLSDLKGKINLSGALGGLKKGFSGIAEFVGKAKDAIADFVKNISPAKVLIFALGAVLILVLLSIRKLANSIAGVADGISGVFGVLFRVPQSNPIINIALAIAILAGSLYLLAQTDSDKLKTATNSLLEVMAGLVIVAAIAAILAKSGIAKDFTGITLGILALSGAILLLAVALKVIESVNLDDMGNQLLAFGIFLAAFVGAAIIFARVLQKNAATLVSTGIYILTFAAGILILAMALEKISTVDLSGVKNNIGVLIVIMGMMSILAIAAKNVSFGSALGIGILALDLLVMVKVLEQLGKVPLNTITKAISQFIAIFVMMETMALVARTAGENAAGAGVSILLMSAAIFILAEVVKKLAELDPEDAWRATAIVDSMLVIFAAIMGLSKFASGEAAKVGVAILAMAASILILGVAIKYIGNLDQDTVIQGTAVVSGLMLLITLFAAVAKECKGAAGAILAITVFVAAIVGAFYALSLLDADQLITQAEALSLVIIALGVCVRLLKSMKFKEALVSVFAMTVVLAEVVGAFYLLSSLDGNAMLVQAEALAIALGTLSVVMATIAGVSKFASVGDVAKGVASFSIVVAAIAAIVAAFGGLNKIPGFADFMAGGAEILQFLASLSTTIITFVAFAAVMGLLGFLPVSAVASGAANFAIVVAAITAIVSALAGLNKIPGFSEFISGGGEIFIQLGGIIGEAIGSLIGGIGVGLTNGLPDMANNLAEFASNMQPFFETMSGVDDSAVSGVKNLAEMMLALTGANILDRLTSWFTGGTSLTDFAAELLTFADPFVEFSNAIKDVDGASVEASANAAMALAQFANNLPKDGGIWQDIVGSVDVGGFAEDLLLFAAPFRMYYEMVKDIDGSVVEASANAAMALAEFSNNLPATGGKLQEFLGEQDMSVFGAQLASFGWAFKMYYDAITNGGGIDFTVVEASANAAKALAELNSNIPASGGTLQSFLGSQDMSVFGAQLASFGWAFKMYYDAITSGGGIDPEVITSSASAAMALAQLANNLPKDGGWMQTIFGSQDISDFGGKLKEFGKALCGYSYWLGFVDVDAVTKSAAAATALTAIQENLPKSGGLSGLFGSQDISDFGGKLVTFGNALADYSAAIAGISWTDLDSAITVVSSFASMTDSLNDINTTGVTNFKSSVKTLASTGVDAFIQAFADAGPAITTAGETLGSNAAVGITNSTGAVQSASGSVAGSGATAIYGYYYSWRSAASYLVQGFSNGIYGNTWRAIDATRYLANQVTTTMQNALEIASPSKVMDKLGGFTTEGFANGMIRLSGMVDASADYISNEALDSMRDAIRRINDIIADDTDFTPTIRPVLDLGNVQAGVQQINTMLGSQQYSLGRNIFIPQIAVDSMEDQNANGANAGKSVTNNFYVQKMDEGMIDYFVNRVNTQLGARA